MNTKESLAIFSKRDKEIRIERDYTTEFVAEKAEIRHEDYLEIEKGTNIPNDLEPVASIAFVLDISLDYLMGFSNEKKPSNQSELLNEYDINDEKQKMTREILHTIMLLDNKEQKELYEIIKNRLNENK